ncbi:MAG: choice-of-anchor D domain-containing protein [Gemmatimonadota bacterium]|nr:MAG: choice-of-anchor D domain-containing protein [Gemmatimonadota bacterium]
MNSRASLPSVILVVSLAISPTRAQQAVLSVGDGFGIPGSKDNVVQIELDNSEVGEVAGIGLHLTFNPNVLSISDISPTERTDSSFIYIFEWSDPDPGQLKLAIVKCRPGIIAGTGSIVDIYFDVEKYALPGEYPLVLLNVDIGDSAANEIPVITYDGMFTVMGGNALRIFGTSGVPGSESNVVFLNLYSEIALSQISLTLNFDSTALSLTNVLPTDRTQDLAHFDWDLLDPGNARLSIQSNEEPFISCGSGSIAHFIFTVSMEVNSGVYPLQLSDVTVLDSGDASVDVTLFDGNFEIGISDIELSAYEYDFGEVSLTDTAYWLFPVSNRGEVDLTISDVVSNDSDFTVVSPLFPMSVRPGSQLQVSVVFTPTSLGPIQGILTVMSNDPDEDTVFVSLTGSGKDPHIELSVTEIDFGNVQMCTSDEKTFSVINTGTGSLIITSVTSDNPTFRVISPAFPETLSEGSDIEVSLIFEPLRMGVYTGTIDIFSDDQENNHITLPVLGSGVMIGEPTLKVGRTYGTVSDTNWIGISLWNDGLLSQANFVAQYESECLIPLSIEPTPRTAPFSDVSFQETEPGLLSVQLSDVNGLLIDEGFGDILSLGFGVISVETDSILSISLSAVSVLDIVGEAIPVALEDGGFILSTLGDSLFMGESSFEGVVPLILSNTLKMSALQADIVFDTSILKVEEVRKTSRSYVVNIFQWSSREFGVSMVMHSEGSIPSGIGSIADIVFEITQGLPACGVPITFEDVKLTDPAGNEIPMGLGDGVFSVSVTELDILDGSGFIGAEDCPVSIRLFNGQRVASIEFDLKYDQTVLLIAQVLLTMRTIDIESIQYQETEPGLIQVSISDDEGNLIEPGEGPIVEVLCDVTSDAAGGTYPLALSHVTLLDARKAVIPTRTKSGIFTIISGGMRLSIGQASGSPGSSDIIVPMNLDSDASIAAMQFDLSFDTNALQVTDVAKTERSASLNIFQHSTVANGIRLAATGIGTTVPAGTGPVARITFNISDYASPGMYWMELSNVKLADPSGSEFAVTPEGNWFTVLEETAVELSQFKAEYKLGKIFLEWSINGSDELSRFSLHRSLNQGINFVKIYEATSQSEEKVYRFRDDGIEISGLYTYELRAVDIPDQECTLGRTSVDVTDIFPKKFALEQNYPNPFNPSTDIRYQIADSGLPVHTTMKIYNILGQEVKTLLDKHQKPGYYTVSWDGRDERGHEVPCGVYFYRLSIDSGRWSETKRMLLLK